MGCVMSRKVSTSSTSSQTSSCGGNRESTSSTTSRSSTASALARYTMGGPTLPNFSPAVPQDSTWLAKPERAYSPVDSPTWRYQAEDKSYSGVLGGIGSLFRSKKVSNPMSDIPLTDTNNTTSPSTTTATTTTISTTNLFSKQKKPKSKKPKKLSSSSIESKLEISWPTSCHHIPVPPAPAVALGYPYPYPFPLSTVPSNLDLVATAEAVEEGVKREQGEALGERQGEEVYCGYYGYEYECLMEAGKEGARGAVRLEIKPGRNQKWERKEVVDEVGQEGEERSRKT
ncbi:hypothetical protein L211DRAFT_866101 [Terfezia boudieri ATCC MYA-4762]|uniref:Uncharacterized protein n=1 Tax=Terfezia boudieri ATCC MYA-4762 TaxID=1051890 RepID=A0A3N4LWF2_9PEZI|nr:hypothetical protein L211DRAFT_866101 [Terfezia boudieri ATCC MYA-4762]